MNGLFGVILFRKSVSSGGNAEWRIAVGMYCWANDFKLVFEDLIKSLTSREFRNENQVRDVPQSIGNTDKLQR